MKEKQNKEDLFEINGGNTTTYNKVVEGTGNIVSNGTFEQTLAAIEKLDSSGKLDYLKN